MGTLPISYAKLNGRPLGLVALAPAHKESTLIELMSVWEAIAPARKPPTAFLKEEAHTAPGAQVEPESGRSEL